MRSKLAYFIILTDALLNYFGAIISNKLIMKVNIIIIIIIMIGLIEECNKPKLIGNKSP